KAGPPFIDGDDRGHDEEKRNEVKQHEIAVHALDVAPETLAWVHAREHGDGAPHDKGACRPGEGRRTRTIFGLAQRQQGVESPCELDQNPKNDGFRSYVREQEAREKTSISDDKRNEGGDAHQENNTPTQAADVTHAR